MKTLMMAMAIYLFGSVPNAGNNVYICVSPSAKKYHASKSCHGLQKCTHTISEVTKADAAKQGYTACKIEYK